MRIAIMQPGYLPWLGFFELMYNCETFVILDDVQYTKKEWRSRNRIRTKNGWMWLSVPVLTKNKRFQLINEVKINNSSPWQKKHLQSIMINYRKANYFEQYFSELKDIYKKSWEYLVDLDMEITMWLSRKLGVTTYLIRSSELKTIGKREEKIINICKAVGAEELYDSKAASSILDINKFQQAGIKIEFQNYLHPSYKQIYEPFLPYMSTLDLLFQYGKQSLAIILGRGKNKMQTT